MWRKQQEEPKVSSPEVREQPRTEQPRAEQSRVEPVAPVPTVSAPSTVPGVVVREATQPNSHLTSTLVIKGEITGRDDLFIDGEVQGKIRIEEGKVTVGPHGRVTAEVEAREIVIRGRVKGNLTARDRIEIGHTGCATGDMITQRIFVEDGAEIHGRVEIRQQKAEVKPVQEQKKQAPVVAAPAAVASPVAGNEVAKPVVAAVQESAPVA